MSRASLAVVTGASTGIGRAIATTLAASGWDIAFTYLHSREAAEETIEAVRAAGAAGLSVQCDVGVKSEVNTFYQTVADWRGAPDLLVNNAGVQTWSPLLDLAEEDWDKVIRTNLKGCFLNTQAAARRMRDAGKGGSIVNIGSGCNQVGLPPARRLHGVERRH